MRWLVVVWLIGGIAVWGQGRAQRATAPSAVSRLLQTLREGTDASQAVREVDTIWQTDRWFTFPKFEETAKNVAAIMRRSGLEDVEIGNPPADGVSQGGFWTMPMAWDLKTGTLEILDPAVPAEMRMLADYQKVPTSIGMWSGPKAGGGVVAEGDLWPARREGGG